MSNLTNPRVAILMGSDSDLGVMRGAADVLDRFAVPYEVRFLSAHRSPSETVAFVEAAPELAIGSPTIGWLRAAYRSCAYLRRPDTARRIPVPMLLVGAGDDRIVSTPAIEVMAGRMKLAAYVALAGARHELMMEQDTLRTRFWAAFDAYLGVEATVA